MDSPDDLLQRKTIANVPIDKEVINENVSSKVEVRYGKQRYCFICQKFM